MRLGNIDNYVMRIGIIYTIHFNEIREAEVSLACNTHGWNYKFTKKFGEEMSLKAWWLLMNDSLQLEEIAWIARCRLFVNDYVGLYKIATDSVNINNNKRHYR
jgi:hypothetical protein